MCWIAGVQEGAGGGPPRARRAARRDEWPRRGIGWPITGMCEAERGQYGADDVSVMPTIPCGPGNNDDPQDSHVPAALLWRFHEAKDADAPTATAWGTGMPGREFLCADDPADATNPIRILQDV